MEQNQFTQAERDLLSVYANAPIEDLTDVELSDFRYLLEKHQLAEKVQCQQN